MCTKMAATISEKSKIYQPKPYCRWKGFCTTWLAGAPSQRVQKFMLGPCLQNLFDTIFIQSVTDPYEK